MSEKPIIRHCRNCKYFYLHSTGGGECIVKYHYVIEETQRLKALLCRYYKQKGSEENG